MLMTKETFISDVLIKLQKELTEEQLRNLKDTLIVQLYDCEIQQNVYDLTLFNEEDNIKIMERYVVDMIVQGLSKKTITAYVWSLKKFFNEVGKNYKDIHKDDILIYFGKLKNANYKQNTIVNQRHNLEAFFKWAFNNEFIYRSPFAGIPRIKNDAVRKEILTDEELEKLRDNCINIKELATIDLLASTGLRVEEVTLVKMKDVNFANKTIEIYAPKTNTYRTVYLDAKATKHLQDYREWLVNNGKYSDYLLGFRDTPLSKGAIERRIRLIKQRAGIDKHITVHTFRKTLATKLKRKGVQPMTISTILGHSTFATTAKYYIGEDTNIQFEYEKAMC